MNKRTSFNPIFSSNIDEKRSSRQAKKKPDCEMLRKKETFTLLYIPLNKKFVTAIFQKNSLKLNLERSFSDELILQWRLTGGGELLQQLFLRRGRWPTYSPSHLFCFFVMDFLIFIIFSPTTTSSFSSQAETHPQILFWGKIHKTPYVVRF